MSDLIRRAREASAAERVRQQEDQREYRAKRLAERVAKLEEQLAKLVGEPVTVTNAAFAAKRPGSGNPGTEAIEAEYDEIRFHFDGSLYVINPCPDCGAKRFFSVYGEGERGLKNLGAALDGEGHTGHKCLATEARDVATRLVSATYGTKLTPQEVAEAALALVGYGFDGKYRVER